MTSRRERGLMESAEWAVITPVVLLLIFGIIQVGLWARGREVAFNAAVVGAEAASAAGSSGGAQEQAHALAERGGLGDVSVEISDDGDQVTARVSGREPALVDLGQTRVSQSVTRPKERVTERP